MSICDLRPIVYGIYLRQKKYRYEFDIKLILFTLKIKNYIELSYNLNNFSNSLVSNERYNVLKLLLSYMYVLFVNISLCSPYFGYYQLQTTIIKKLFFEMYHDTFRHKYYILI